MSNKQIAEKVESINFVIEKCNEKLTVYTQKEKLISEKKEALTNKINTLKAEVELLLKSTK